MRCDTARSSSSQLLVKRFEIASTANFSSRSSSSTNDSSSALKLAAGDFLASSLPLIFFSKKFRNCFLNAVSIAPRFSLACARASRYKFCAARSTDFSAISNSSSSIVSKVFDNTSTIRFKAMSRQSLITLTDSGFTLCRRVCAGTNGKTFALFAALAFTAVGSKFSGLIIEAMLMSLSD